ENAPAVENADGPRLSGFVLNASRDLSARRSSTYERGYARSATCSATGLSAPLREASSPRACSNFASLCGSNRTAKRVRCWCALATSEAPTAAATASASTNSPRLTPDLPIESPSPWMSARRFPRPAPSHRNPVLMNCHRPRNRRAPKGRGRAAVGRNELLLGAAAGEPERDDSRPPGADHDRVLGEVLLRVPERAVVARVDGDIAVVAPASLGLGLRAGAGVRDLLGLGELPERVAGRAAGVPDRRIVVRPGRAEAGGDVALLVLGDRAHPAPDRIGEAVGGRVGALLVDRGSAAPGDAQLVPTDARAVVGLDRVVQQHRRVGTEVPVVHPEHQPVAEHVEPLRSALLRNAVAVAVDALRPHVRRDRERVAR